MNQLALQFPGQPLAIREVSLWTVVRAHLTFLSVWAQSSPGWLSGPSCPLVLARGWKGLFWSLTLAVSHRWVWAQIPLFSHIIALTLQVLKNLEHGYSLLVSGILGLSGDADIDTSRM